MESYKRRRHTHTHTKNANEKNEMKRINFIDSFIFFFLLDKQDNNGCNKCRSLNYDFDDAAAFRH